MSATPRTAALVAQHEQQSSEWRTDNPARPIIPLALRQARELIGHSVQLERDLTAALALAAKRRDTAVAMSRLHDESEKEIEQLHARIAELESGVQYHNGMCEASCEMRRDDGHCEPYITRGKPCPDCPHDWLIEIDAARERDK